MDLLINHINKRGIDCWTLHFQSHSDESKEREKALMTHLQRSNESQERTANALEGIHSSLSKLEGRIDRIEKHTFNKESA